MSISEKHSLGGQSPFTKPVTILRSKTHFHSSPASLSEPSGLARKTVDHRFPHHNLHLYGSRAALEDGLLTDSFEAKSIVEFQVLDVAGFEIAKAVFGVCLLGGVFDEGLCKAFASRAGFRANVDEVPSVSVVLAQRFVFGFVQQGEEFIEESDPTFFGELESEREQSAPELATEVIEVLTRWHPVPC